MDQDSKFITKYLKGQIQLSQLNGYIDHWNAHEHISLLYEFLGFSKTDFAKVMINPGCMESLLASMRRSHYEGE